MNDTADALRDELRGWLDRHAGNHRLDESADLASEVRRSRRLQQTLHAAGLLRAGWPAEAGGTGGTPLLRAVVAEEIAAAGLLSGVSSQVFGFIEILGPAFLAYADPRLAEEVLAAFVAGRELWCQGFSEPDAGSDLASLRTIARRDDAGWVVSGQKVWTSLAQFADRCVLLARTGPVEDRHRGISVLLVDMASPGITVRPMRAMGGAEEFCELFFDDVVIPDARLIGQPNGGWSFVLHVLGCERGAVFWQRAAWLQRRLNEAVEHGDLTASEDGLIGDAFLKVYGARARSRRTQLLMATGALPGHEASLDKLLMTAAEQGVFDVVRELQPGLLELGNDPAAHRWRDEWFYSRAASIYGGTSEIQRNGIAERLLGLPRSG